MTNPFIFLCIQVLSILRFSFTNKYKPPEKLPWANSTVNGVTNGVIFCEMKTFGKYIGSYLHIKAFMRDHEKKNLGPIYCVLTPTL